MDTNNLDFYNAILGVTYPSTINISTPSGLGPFFERVEGKSWDVIVTKMGGDIPTDLTDPKNLINRAFPGEEECHTQEKMYGASHWSGLSI